MLTNSGRPRKACTKCQTHKVRCSGDRPVCKRCTRLRHTCKYQDVRDSSLPSQSTQATRTAKTGPPLMTLSRDEILPQPHPPLGPASSLRESSEVARNVSEQYFLGIPPTLLSALVETYYACVYNASLLLHKEAFLAAVSDGTARGHVVLGVCAIAANFHQDSNGNLSLKDHGFMMDWAERAAKQVLQEAEYPREDNVVTFMNLSLFWYAQGMWRRSYMHKGNAALTAHLLGCGVNNPKIEQTWASEVSHRRYWACYLMACHSSDVSPMLPPEQRLKQLSLPSREEDFEARQVTVPRVCLDSGDSNEGLYCELIKVMTLWSAVNILLKSPLDDSSARIASLYSMDTKISAWRSRLPQSLELNASTVSQLPSNILPKLLLIHIVYHQCLMALHASVVPLFSCSKEDDISTSALQLSAQIAYEHASSSSALFQAVLQTVTDLSVIPSYIGYAAYCGCAILIPFLWCTEDTVRDRARANVKTNARIIHSIARYWKFMSLSERYVHHLYKMHAQNSTPLENEPKHIDVVRLMGFRFSASKARKTILGFNSILWSSDGRYATQGEEVMDIGVEEQQALSESSLTRNSTTTSGVLIDKRRSFDNHLPVVNPTRFTGEPTTISNFEDRAPPSQLEDEFSDEQVQFLNSDYFRFFRDPETLFFLPNAMEPDSTQFEADSMGVDLFDTLDFLDGN